MNLECGLCGRGVIKNTAYTNYTTFLFPQHLLTRECIFFLYRKVSVHQTSIDANGKSSSVLRVNSTEKRDGGFFTCKVIRMLNSNIKVSKTFDHKLLNCITKRILKYAKAKNYNEISKVFDLGFLLFVCKQTLRMNTFENV